jgi:prolyl oligopeptidase
MKELPVVRGVLSVVAVCFVVISCRVDAGETATVPRTPKKPVTAEMHGVKIADDFRWLENGDDPAVRSWSAAQTQHARQILEQCPALPALRQRVKQLMSHTSPDYLALNW